MRRRSARAGRSSVANLFLLLGLLALGGAVYLWLPGWWDFQEMREIGRLVVTDWHVQDRLKAGQDRYQQELEERQMPYYIPDKACGFEESAGSRRMKCSWNADITVPVIDYVIPRTYTFTTEISSAGKVRQY